MKTLVSFVIRRPWLLVIAAFVFLIAGWVATIAVASRHPHDHLTPDQEEAVLARARGGATP